MIEKLDLNMKFPTYGDIAKGKGEKTGILSADVHLVFIKLNEIIKQVNWLTPCKHDVFAFQNEEHIAQWEKDNKKKATVCKYCGRWREKEIIN